MEQYLLIDYDKVKSSFKSDDDDRYNVFVRLSCKPCFANVIIRQYSEPLIQRTYQPLIETFVQLSLDDEEEGRESMDRDLREWPLQPEARQWLIDCAMKDVRELFQCMPPHDDTLLLNLRVRANHVRVNYEQQEEIVCMVPADESSIESLEKKKKKKKIIDCSICLDEILIGAEALPCCHVFHKDCIKKWLSTSHSCPVCRYQMPS